MTIGLDQKKAIVAEVSEVAKASVTAVAAEYRGLTVTEMTELRRQARDNGVDLRVVRNTLAKRALLGTDFECLNDKLVGPIILSFAKDDPGASARVIKDFAKDHDKLVVKGLSIGGKLLEPAHIDVVAKLPTRDEAIAKLMNCMQAPIVKFIRTLKEPQSKLVRTFVALKEQKEA